MLNESFLSKFLHRKKMENQVEKSSIECELEKRLQVKLISIVCTVLYAICFISFLWIQLCGGIIFTLCCYGLAMGLISIVANLCITFSMLIAICRIWSQYYKQNYRKVYWSCALPLLTFLSANIIVMILKKIVTQ
jgi:hypothetical protein